MEHHALVFVILGLCGLAWLGVEVRAQSVSQSELAQSQRAQNAVVTAAALGSCQRLNVERARNNRGWLHAYRANRNTLAFDQTFKALVIVGVKHPTLEQQRNARLFLDKLNGEITGTEQNIAALEWTPLTPCQQAVERPLAYVPPTPVRFSRTGNHHTPPRSALVVAE